jgi:hypothetical protein
MTDGEQRPQLRESEVKLAVALSCFVSVLVGWAIFGSPPYGFFGFLRITLAVTSALVIWFRYKQTQGTSLGSVFLGIIAYVHLTSHMKRAEWAFFNYVAIALLGLCTWNLVRQFRADEMEGAS